MFRTANRSVILRRIAASTALSGALLVPQLVQAQALPTGGTVTTGTATIASNTNTLTVTQTTSKATINFDTFNVAQSNTVNVNQPNANSSTLARVTSTTASTIAGNITATGALYLVNPNGIAITQSGVVQTGRGFVASILGITDTNFNNNTLNFSAATGSSAGVTHAGSITVGSGATINYVALLGATVAVSQDGTITVPRGKVGIGSGQNITLNLSGNFLAVSTPITAITSGNTALIELAGNIAAAGGAVTISAATANDVVRNLINLGSTGVVSVDTSSGIAGRIDLLGGQGGTVIVKGALTARQTGSTGNGGTIVTTGAVLDFSEATINASGVTRGTWTANASNLIVGAAEASTINNALANNNVTLTTSAAIGSQATPHNLVVDSAIGWTTRSSLQLLAANDITLNAAISGRSSTTNTNATLFVAAATGRSVTPNASISVDIFNLQRGNWVQNAATLPSFFARDFRVSLNGIANFMRAVGGDGAAATPYLIADVYGLGGMVSPNTLSSAFALNNVIDASGTSAWNSNAGFAPIGTDGTGTALNSGNGFSGSFDGRNFNINGLTIGRTTALTGLFGYVSGALSNVRMAGGTVRGGGATGTGALVGRLVGGSVTDSSSSSAVFAVNTTAAVGGLVGAMLNGASVSGSSATGNVVADGKETGGLVGSVVQGLAGTSSIINSFATGRVSTSQALIASLGGLVGSITTTGSASGTNATIINSYATGSVTASSTSSSQVGGLVGTANSSGSSAPVSMINAYATGNVQSGAGDTGGLIGLASGTTVSNVYATGTVTGGSAIGGLIGFIQASTITDAYATGRVNSNQFNVGGLIGSFNTSTLRNAYATGVVSTTLASTSTAVGGLVGNMFGATGSITNAYATGAVSSAGGIVGGLIGQQTQAGNTISGVYATGSVTGTNNVGGLVGTQGSGTSVTAAYATGAVSGTSSVGGLIGSTNGTTTSAYWDSYSTGRTDAFGVGTPGAAVTAVTSDPAQASAANYAYNVSAYVNLPGAANLGTAAVNGFAFLPGGTRPFLAFEVPVVGNPGIVSTGGFVTLGNSHQLQLVNYNATTLAGSFRLGNGIDLVETGSVVVGTPGSYAGMWAPTGFVSLGTDGAGSVWNGTAFVPLAANAAAYGYGGTFDGGGFALTGLSIARPTAAYSGLFGVTNGLVQNVAVTGSVSGATTTGGLVGFLFRGGRVTGSSSAVNVRASGTILGGLIGSAGSGTLVRFSNASGTVNGTTNVGGLIGYASEATVDRNFATGAASGTSYIGGLIGYSYLGTTIDSYARGAVSASNTSAGGLIGKIVGGSVARTYSTGAVTAATRAGGLIGAADASANVSASYWDTQTSGQTVSAGGMGRTTTEMRDPATYSGWDFTTVWKAPTATTNPTLRPAAQPVP